MAACPQNEGDAATNSAAYAQEKAEALAQEQEGDAGQRRQKVAEVLAAAQVKRRSGAEFGGVVDSGGGS